MKGQRAAWLKGPFLASLVNPWDTMVPSLRGGAWGRVSRTAFPEPSQDWQREDSQMPWGQVGLWSVPEGALFPVARQGCGWSHRSKTGAQAATVGPGICRWPCDCWVPRQGQDAAPMGRAGDGRHKWGVGQSSTAFSLSSFPKCHIGSLGLPCLNPKLEGEERVRGSPPCCPAWGEGGLLTVPSPLPSLQSNRRHDCLYRGIDPKNLWLVFGWLVRFKVSIQSQCIDQQQTIRNIIFHVKTAS